MIRLAEPSDAPAIAVLLDQLGYPTNGPEVVERLQRLSASDQAIAVVAEIDDRVAGLATGHVFQSIHATPLTAWLTTLVVASDHHGRGVGRRLASAIEEWARKAGAVRLSVTSGTHRDEAHAFYEHIGYERSGVRFTKALG